MWPKALWCCFFFKGKQPIRFGFFFLNSLGCENHSFSVLGEPLPGVFFFSWVSLSADPPVFHVSTIYSNKSWGMPPAGGVPFKNSSDHYHTQLQKFNWHTKTPALKAVIHSSNSPQLSGFFIRPALQDLSSSLTLRFRSWIPGSFPMGKKQVGCFSFRGIAWNQSWRQNFHDFMSHLKTHLKVN